MIACGQGRCRYCYLEDGVKVCTTDPVLIHVPESRVFILKCNTYLKRDRGDKLSQWSPKLPDGLYPGQIKPPVDYSDRDPDEPVVATDDDSCDT